MVTLHAQKTLLLVDPTSPDGETSLALLGPDDTHTAVVALLKGGPSAALHEFAAAEEIDSSTAASIYLDQVAERIARPDRIVETIVVGGSDPATELSSLIQSSDIRRVLVPASLPRLQPGAFSQLVKAWPQLIVAAPSSGQTRTAKAHQTPGRLPQVLRRLRRVPTVLRDNPLAERIPAWELQKLVELSTVVEVDADTGVIRQGAPGRKCLIVVEGALCVEIDGVELAELGAGEIAGELALITGSPCNASVTARSDALVLAISRSDFDALLDACPRLGNHILHTAVGRIARAA